jgi:hypothetical protein
MKQFFAGIVIGAVLTGVLMNRITGQYVPEEVKVTQISGEKITHTGFKYTDSTIKFSTTAEGKGEIFTEIPKVNIPEARAWMRCTNSVAVELIFADRRMYGLSYSKRWNNFSTGGGVILSESRFEGVKFQAGYWFEF